MTDSVEGAVDLELETSRAADLVSSSLRTIARYLTHGQSEHGHWQVSYEIHDGTVRNIRYGHGPITNSELAQAPT